MCLPSSWIPVLETAGHQAIHWKNIGAYNALDSEIVEWARRNGYIIFTHDLDFGTILALTNATGPSVIQARTQDVTPEHLGSLALFYLQKYQSDLITGALLVIDEARARVNLLPLQVKPSA